MGCAVVSGVLKQVWDLSDQDNDSMLSLREFCTALYFMERFREGRALPSTLPGGIHPADSSQGPAGGAGQGPGGQSGAVWRHIPGLAICEALGDGGVQWGGVLRRCLGLRDEGRWLSDSVFCNGEQVVRRRQWVARRRVPLPRWKRPSSSRCRCLREAFRHQAKEVLGQRLRRVTNRKFQRWRVIWWIS